MVLGIEDIHQRKTHQNYKRDSRSSAAGTGNPGYDAPLYSFRHTGASLLIASGMDVKEVSAHLGHSRASTTLDKYTHLFEKAAQHTTDVMTDAIKKARSDSRNNGPDTPMKEAK